MLASRACSCPAAWLGKYADTLKLWLDVTDNEVIWNKCKQGLQGGPTRIEVARSPSLIDSQPEYKTPCAKSAEEPILDAETH